MDFRRRSRGHLHLLPALCVSAVFSGISFTSVAAPGDEQFILQQQRQQALEQQLTPPVPDIRLSPSEHSAGRIVFPAETPCFTLHSVTLTGHNDLPRWLPLQAWQIRLWDTVWGRRVSFRSKSAQKPATFSQ
ncbi:hypothetical protein ACSSMI_21890 [Escherichia coli]|uniref:hypothetical protein n=1 Tax=Escherichia coli TaxID=562 RepID=UPI0010E6599F|nr:hypothetical protein [Escherichia coli]EID2896546.1 hypothetical protein [Escherichia coli]EJF3594778.1 hypothetical protein [Escherichia coli]EKD5325378.1 hypothetical protein [Escherichia coli]MCP8738696.1 hypothetical protein [Escherichia coli]MCX3861328.1 hypothetical protein [Escherichia coli]